MSNRTQHERGLVPVDCRSRRENLEKARVHLLAGNVSAAEDCYQKAVSITSSMAKQLIEVSGGVSLHTRTLISVRTHSARVQTYTCTHIHTHQLARACIHAFIQTCTTAFTLKSSRTTHTHTHTHTHNAHTTHTHIHKYRVSL